MRILLVTSKLNFVTAGGSVLDLHLKAKALLELGHEITVITAFSRANNMPEPLPYVVREEDLTSRGWFAQQKKLYRLLKKYEALADVFYIDGNIFLYGGGAYRLLGGKIPVVAFFNIVLSCLWDTQNNDLKRQALPSKLKRRLRLFVEHRLGVPIANCLDAFIFTTPFVEKMYLDFGFKKSKSNVIPDFVNTNSIIAAGTLTPEKLADLHRNANQVNILTSGRMIKEKGFDLVIQALAQLPGKNNIRLIMSGGGPEAEHLHQLARELKVDHLIHFPGWVSKDELARFFRQAHIFILPKWWIAYTSVLLIEAMAYGLPAIVPAGGGAEWLTKDGALTFLEDSADELTARIKQLSVDPEMRIRLARKNLINAGELDYINLGKRILEVMELITRL